MLPNEEQATSHRTKPRNFNELEEQPASDCRKTSQIRCRKICRMPTLGGNRRNGGFGE